MNHGETKNDVIQRLSTALKKSELERINQSKVVNSFRDDMEEQLEICDEMIEERTKLENLLKAARTKIAVLEDTIKELHSGQDPVNKYGIR